jgi:hypothetical protein
MKGSNSSAFNFQIELAVGYREAVFVLVGGFRSENREPMETRPRPIPSDATAVCDRSHLIKNDL